MRQLSFGIVDLTLHTTYSAATDGDVVAYSRELLAPFSPAPLPPEHAMINSFTHLFANPVGYAGGYYSYKWSEVLDADAFSRFRAEGVFSAEAGLAISGIRFSARATAKIPPSCTATSWGAIRTPGRFWSVPGCSSPSA
jgi:Zn-dependent oligopeptidase